VTVRLALLVLFAAVLATGAPAAPSAAPEGELAYTVTLRGYALPGSNPLSADAACVGRVGDFRSARRLTGISSWARYEVSWAPDGDRVAIEGGAFGDTAIRVAAPDGTDTHAVSHPGADDRDSAPTWSPDGTRIAFSRYGSGYGIWIVDLRTGEEQRISQDGAWSLDWAPAGGLIAADTTQEFPRDVLILKEDGTLVRRVPRPQGWPFQTGVSWSPDGSRLAIGGGLILDRNGDAVGRFASGSRDVAVRSPEWSPDGATIVYVRAPIHAFARTNTNYLDPADLYSSPSDGGTESRLTRTPNLDEGKPDFRPAAGTKPARTTSCVLSGTSRGDVIRGTNAGDLIDAGRGADVVYGRGGNDMLAGGAGDDRLFGGSGRDQLDGNTGRDRLYARDRERDSLTGASGLDRAWIDRSGDWARGVEIYKRG
jgi:dipeptidyl aminopeptidase/acylaminoacyl peptidase